MSFIEPQANSSHRQTSTGKTTAAFGQFVLNVPRFAIIVDQLTANTYIMVVVKPGESNINTVKINMKIAREDFAKLDVTGSGVRRQPVPPLPGPDYGDEEPPKSDEQVEITYE